MLTSLLLLLPLAATMSQDPQGTPPIPDDTEIVELPSGLKYSVLTPGGEGTPPNRGDKVLVHYTGWTTDGKVFDSSRQRGTPAEFSVGQLIDGWNEGLMLMTPGARWKMTIPSALGYGERGAPPRIPANATLIFDVELIEVTDRALPYQPWNADAPVVELKDGVQMQSLTEGSGDQPAGTFGFVKIGWAIYSTEGEVLFTDSMLGQDLSGDPSRIVLPFFQQALAVLKPGGSCNLRIPRAVGASWLQKLRIDEPYEHTIWQLSCKDARTFTKPEFVLPPDEELTATPSGLKYKIVRAGEGKKPAGPMSSVTVHYCGWLADNGKQFDASYDRGQPISFGLSQVIPGWTEGMQLIGEGGAVILVIPSDLGYGDRGSPPTIPGGATLVFYVETLGVQD